MNSTIKYLQIKYQDYGKSFLVTDSMSSTVGFSVSTDSCAGEFVAYVEPRKAYRFLHFRKNLPDVEVFDGKSTVERVRQSTDIVKSPYVALIERSKRGVGTTSDGFCCWVSVVPWFWIIAPLRRPVNHGLTAATG